MFKVIYCLVALCLVSCSSNERELHIFGWADYIKPEIIHKFEKEYNCIVTLDTYDSNEAMYAKLKLGATGYDLIFPSNYTFEMMHEQKMVQKLDSNLLLNRKYLDNQILRKFNHDHFSDYFVPFMINYTGIAYRKDKIEDMDSSWKIFSRRSLKGRMTMLNDLREVMGAGLRTLGHSINSTDEREIEEAAELIISWKKNLAKFESEQYKSGIASAEYLISQAYNGDILQVMQENQNVDFVFPMEGSTLTCDYMVVPKNAPHPELAQQFMNFLLDPRIAAENIEYTCYLSPNTEAYPLLKESFKTSLVLFPPQEVLEKAEILKNVGAKIIIYTHAWDKIKSAE